MIAVSFASLEVAQSMKRAVGKTDFLNFKKITNNYIK